VHEQLAIAEAPFSFSQLIGVADTTLCRFAQSYAQLSASRNVIGGR
jgi:hypothetical protein